MFLMARSQKQNHGRSLEYALSRFLKTKKYHAILEGELSRVFYEQDRKNYIIFFGLCLLLKHSDTRLSDRYWRYKACADYKSKVCGTWHPFSIHHDQYEYQIIASRDKFIHLRMSDIRNSFVDVLICSITEKITFRYFHLPVLDTQQQTLTFNQEQL
jgi:hypothetical protein